MSLRHSLVFLRRLIVLSAVLLSAAAHAQQAPCIDGVATHEGTSYSCSGVDLQARISLADMGGTYGNSLWGWTDPMSGGEYAIMGTETGAVFVDISQPTSPRILGRMPPTTTVSQWRDMRVYQNRAYVVSEALGHGVQVFDLTRLRSLSHDPQRLLEPDYVFHGQPGYTIGSAHTITINEATGFAYAVGARSVDGFHYVCDGGLYMMNLGDSLQPSFAGCFGSDGYTHEATCIAYSGPDQRYHEREVCFAANGRWPTTDYNRIAVIDVTNKMQPQQLSEAIYPNDGYIHQGWFTEDHRYFIANDELDERRHGFQTRTLVFDVADLENPEYIGSYWHDTYSIDHNLYIKGNRVYASNYMTGLRILDISSLVDHHDLEGVSTAAYFDTYPDRDCLTPQPECAQSGGFQGAWNNYPFFASGNVIVSDINRGLFVLRPADSPVSNGPTADRPIARVEVYPNPFQHRGQVSIRLDADQRVRAEVFDVLGRSVAVLFDEELPAGALHERSIDLQGRPAGLYILRVTGEHFAVSRRVTLVR